MSVSAGWKRGAVALVDLGHGAADRSRGRFRIATDLASARTGVEVPAATIVTPITHSETPNPLAISEGAFTKK